MAQKQDVNSKGTGKPARPKQNANPASETEDATPGSDAARTETAAAKASEQKPAANPRTEGSDEPAKPAATSAVAKPPPSTATSGTPPPTAGAPKPGGGEPPARRGGAALAALALLLALIALGGAAYLWYALQQSDQRAQSAHAEAQREVAELRAQLSAREPLEARVATLTQSLDELTAAERLEAEQLQAMEQALRTLDGQSRDAATERGQLARAITEQREQLKGLQNDQRRLNTALNEAVRPLAEARTRRAAAEALSLATAANERLLLARDVSGARTALRLADERLADLDDPRVHAAREAVTRDLAALRGVPRLDREGLALRLAALAAQVDELPVAGARAPQRTGASGVEGSGREAVDWRDWRGLLGAVWNDLRGLVVIRREGEAIGALMPPEQQYFLRQNLQLKLEQARLALLMGDAATYQRTLQDAHGWLGEHFSDAAATQAAREEIGELGQVELRGELPDISGSVQALRELRGRLEPQDGGA